MLRKQKLHITSACIAYLWGIGINDHPLLDYGVACGDQLMINRYRYHFVVLPPLNTPKP